MLLRYEFLLVARHAGLLLPCLSPWVPTGGLSWSFAVLLLPCLSLSKKRIFAGPRMKKHFIPPARGMRQEQMSYEVIQVLWGLQGNSQWTSQEMDLFTSRYRMFKDDVKLFFSTCSRVDWANEEERRSKVQEGIYQLGTGGRDHCRSYLDFVICSLRIASPATTTTFANICKRKFPKLPARGWGSCMGLSYAVQTSLLRWQCD